MLELVRELGIETAWHTRSVPQPRRRAEILRFMRGPACRLFLSTDSGSVGLDLPWNRRSSSSAWRKHQTRSVSVVNLVCEQSIEHGIMFLLARKQALADGLLDGEGDISKLKMPSGRAALIERIQAMMEAGEAALARIVTSDESVAEELRERHGDRVLLVECAVARTAVCGCLRCSIRCGRKHARRAEATSTACSAATVLAACNERGTAGAPVQ